MTSVDLPELLAPAGDWAALKAAVAQGADAVYFGVEAFNARLRAENFQLDDLAEIMAWLHARGVRGFLTFNVLVFSDELTRAAQLLVAAEQADVDALIVQDLGLCMLAKQLVPGLALHGSTQMSITSAAGVAQAADAGCERVVLARELALKDLERLQRQLKERDLPMPLEVFVHGALCVAYSGQCLTSEALGQRSANRGECAQACRLPYQMVVDGEELDLGDQRYLLSPQDLSAWLQIPRLVELGIASFKIEGRLKDATYVAAATQAYRQQIDGVESDPALVRRQLELGFSRGLSSGWLEGVNHRHLVHARWSKKRGPVVGRLEHWDHQGRLTLRVSETLELGQGVVLEVEPASGADPLAPPKEVGGRIMQIDALGKGRCRIRLGPGRIRLQGLQSGAPVWLTADPSWQSTWQRQAKRTTDPLPQPLKLRVSGALGAPLQLQLIDPTPADQPPMCLSSVVQLARATGAGLSRERLEAQLGRLGGTGWVLSQLEVDLEAGLFLPVAELNRLRRQLLEQMERAGLHPHSARGLEQPAPIKSAQIDAVVHQCLMQASASDQAEVTAFGRTKPKLQVLIRSLTQLEALVAMDRPDLIAGVVADLEQPSELKQAVAIGRGCWQEGLRLAGPRITRPDEAWTLEPLIRAEPDGYLVRNADQLERLTPLAPCSGDFSLNTANPLTLHWYRQRWGLDRLTASYDLNLSQLLDLARSTDPQWLEITLHQHMPLFHMEHCLFCAFLSDGHDHTDCGRPCESHDVRLKDRSGVEHPLVADLGCRNTLFNGRAQSGVEALPDLLTVGLRRFRLELLDEDAQTAQRRVQLYAQALDGSIPSADVWRRERIDHRLGVTRGSLRADGPERTSRIHS